MQEARLGRWLLIYGVLQVLSALDQKPAGHESGRALYNLWKPLNLTPPWLISEKSFLDFRDMGMSSHPFKRYLETQGVEMPRSRQRPDEVVTRELSNGASRNTSSPISNYLGFINEQDQWPARPFTPLSELHVPLEQEQSPDMVNEHQSKHKSQPSANTWLTVETEIDDDGIEEAEDDESEIEHVSSRASQ